MSQRPPIKNLDALSDVVITSPADNQALLYKTASTAWINATVPNSALASLTDVNLTTPADGQILRYDGASSKWIDYGPLAFTDITGNIDVTQMASGSGASAATFWRGDKTWASPTGAAPGTSNTVLKSDGLNWIASPETYAAPGTSGNQMTSDGTNWISAAPVSSTYINASLAGQTPAAAEFYLAGSTITLPAGTWKAGGIYRCTFDMLKGGAGTAGIILTVRMGTLGTTGDASIATISFGAGTAISDYGAFEVWINFRSVGSGSSAVISLSSRCTHGLAATGLTSTGASGIAMPTTVASTGFNSTTATKLGITFTGGTSFSGTSGFLQTDYKQ